MEIVHVYVYLYTYNIYIDTSRGATALRAPALGMKKRRLSWTSLANHIVMSDVGRARWCEGTTTLGSVLGTWRQQALDTHFVMCGCLPRAKFSERSRIAQHQLSDTQAAPDQQTAAGCPLFPQPAIANPASECNILEPFRKAGSPIIN